MLLICRRLQASTVVIYRPQAETMAADLKEKTKTNEDACGPCVALYVLTSNYGPSHSLIAQISAVAAHFILCAKLHLSKSLYNKFSHFFPAHYFLG